MSTSVFPAYVGMSPAVPIGDLPHGCVPRIRGDEPDSVPAVLQVQTCSPHTWG